MAVAQSQAAKDQVSAVAGTLEKGAEVISASPFEIAAVFVILAPLIFLLIWAWFRQELRAKSATIFEKEATIGALLQRIEVREDRRLQAEDARQKLLDEVTELRKKVEPIRETEPEIARAVDEVSDAAQSASRALEWTTSSQEPYYIAIPKLLDEKKKIEKTIRMTENAILADKSGKFLKKNQGKMKVLEKQLKDVQEMVSQARIGHP